MIVFWRNESRDLTSWAYFSYFSFIIHIIISSSWDFYHNKRFFLDLFLRNLKKTCEKMWKKMLRKFVRWNSFVDILRLCSPQFFIRNLIKTWKKNESKSWRFVGHGRYLPISFNTAESLGWLLNMFGTLIDVIFLFSNINWFNTAPKISHEEEQNFLPEGILYYFRLIFRKINIPIWTIEACRSYESYHGNGRLIKSLFFKNLLEEALKTWKIFYSLSCLWITFLKFQ